MKECYENTNGTWKISGIPQMMGVEKGKEIQTKGIGNLFNRIIAEKFPNFKKERITQVQEAYRTIRNKKVNIPRNIIIKTLST
jgi:hypothetical protein